MSDVKTILDLGTVVAKALQDEAKKKDNSLTPADAIAVAPTIAAKVEAKATKEVQAIVTNLANQEPWYRSRVIIGTGVSILAQLASFTGHQFDLVEQTAITNLIFDGITLIGGLYALYGRLVTNKPIGV